METTGKQTPKIIAHRGASAKAPENTLDAFMLAAEMKADMIELDVHLSNDGILVVIHDTTVNRTTDCSGPVWQYSAEQLKDMGVPALREVFHLLPTWVGVNVEVKAPGEGDTRNSMDLAKSLIAELETFATDRYIIVSSFDYNLLEIIHRLDSKLDLAYLYAVPQLPGTLSAKLASGTIKAIHPYHILVTKELVSKAHNNEVLVNVWTVDKIENIYRLAKLGVDGLITNVPDISRQALCIM